MSTDKEMSFSQEERPKGMTTSSGVYLKFVAVPPLLISKIQSSGTMPPVPTRKIVIDFDDEGGSDSQEEPLTEKDLQDDEEKKRWAEYVAKREEVLGKRNDKFLKAIFALGVDVDLTQIDTWKRTMEYLELEVPTDPLDLKVQFIQTEAIRTNTEIVDVIVGVIGQSEVPQEELDSMKSMFLDSIRRPAAGKSAGSEGEVEVEPDLHGDESGEILGRVAALELLQSE